MVEVGNTYMIYAKHKKARRAHPIGANGTIQTRKIYALMFTLENEGQVRLFNDQLEQLRTDNPDYTFEPRKQG